MSTDFIVPPGKATGCLWRKRRVGEFCPIFSERSEVLPQDEIRRVLALRKAAGIRSRQFIKEILDQDGAGSCATESTTQGLMTTRVLQNLPHVKLNPWFMYHTTSGGRDQGSSIDEDLQFARDVGVAS